MNVTSRKKTNRRREKVTVKSLGRHTKDILFARTKNQGVIQDENKAHSLKKVVRQEK